MKKYYYIFSYPKQGCCYTINTITLRVKKYFAVKLLRRFGKINYGAW